MNCSQKVGQPRIQFIFRDKDTSYFILLKNVSEGVHYKLPLFLMKLCYHSEERTAMIELRQ